MTENDLYLINLARSTQTDDVWIETKLIPKADTDEARELLQEIAWDAFSRKERLEFDHDFDF